MNPAARVLAIERTDRELLLLRQNRERFGAYNIQVVGGEAPSGLAGDQSRPHSVFVGGSGHQLVGILDLCRNSLEDCGRLVASFVTLENLSLCLQRIDSWQWRRQVTQIAIARSEELGGLTSLRPERSVWVVRTDKPGGGR